MIGMCGYDLIVVLIRWCRNGLFVYLCVLVDVCMIMGVLIWFVVVMIVWICFRLFMLKVGRL